MPPLTGTSKCWSHTRTREVEAKRKAARAKGGRNTRVGYAVIPNKGQVLQRYYGWYANRTRGIRRRTATHGQASAAAVEVEPVPPSLQQARRRWAELLRRIFEVDPLRCSRCGHEMRIVAFITQPRVIDRMLTHLRRIATEPRRSRAPPPRWTSSGTATSA